LRRGKRRGEEGDREGSGIGRVGNEGKEGKGREGLPISYELQIWQMYSEHACEQKHLDYLGEKGAWAYPGTAQISRVYPII